MRSRVLPFVFLALLALGACSQKSSSQPGQLGQPGGPRGDAEGIGGDYTQVACHALAGIAPEIVSFVWDGDTGLADFYGSNQAVIYSETNLTATRKDPLLTISGVKFQLIIDFQSELDDGSAAATVTYSFDGSTKSQSLGCVLTSKP